MKSFKEKFLSLLLALAVLLSLSETAFAAVSKSELSAVQTETADYIYSSVKAPKFGSIGGEWTIIGLARSGHDVPLRYWDDYYAGVEDYVEACKGVLHKRKYTEYSRLVLALTAIGADPTNVNGYNLLIPLGDFEKTVWQGINGPVWALLALDSGNYGMPINTEAKTQATRQMYIDEILRYQLDNGGWNLTDEGGDGQADPDVTGMALQALAKYQSQPKVKAATAKALACLSEMQNENGGYSSWKAANSESVGQVIIALCELGIDLQDSRFVKDGHTLLDNLLGYRNADGSFSHNGSNGDQMATEQGFCSIVAAMRSMQGKNSLYRMSDCTIRVSYNAGVDTVGLRGKHADVQKIPITVPGTTFADITNHENKTAIEELGARGIITGYNATNFGPNDTMTRAQFATIVVRGLGLPLMTSNNFSDVKAGSWYASYVGTAYAYGIVNGRTATTFDPEGTITRQEAATMVARAAKLCGMDTELETYEILNVLAQFSDYMSIGEWARENMAFCYGEDILNQSDLNAEPNRAILRCEIAQMLYNMLAKAELM